MLLVPNLSRQYCIEPVAPWAKVMLLQSPRLGAVIEPLLFVSRGWPKLSSLIEVTVIVSVGVPFMVRFPDTEKPTPATGLTTTPGAIVRLPLPAMVRPLSST